MHMGIYYLGTNKQGWGHAQGRRIQAPIARYNKHVLNDLIARLKEHFKVKPYLNWPSTYQNVAIIFSSKFTPSLSLYSSYD